MSPAASRTHHALPHLAPPLQITCRPFQRCHPVFPQLWRLESLPEQDRARAHRNPGTHEPAPRKCDSGLRHWSCTRDRLLPPRTSPLFSLHGPNTSPRPSLTGPTNPAVPAQDALPFALARLSGLCAADFWPPAGLLLRASWVAGRVIRGRCDPKAGVISLVFASERVNIPNTFIGIPIYIMVEYTIRCVVLSRGIPIVHPTTYALGGPKRLAAERNTHLA